MFNALSLLVMLMDASFWRILCFMGVLYIYVQILHCCSGQQPRKAGNECCRGLKSAVQEKIAGPSTRGKKRILGPSSHVHFYVFG